MQDVTFKAIRAFIGRCLLGVMLVHIGGCSLFGSDSLEPFEIDSFAIVTELDANRDSPTAIDVVEIYDAQLKLQIEALNADQWFSQKTGVLAGNSDVLTVTSWELPPGVSIQDPRWSELGRTPEAILVFVGLQTGTPNRFELRSRNGTFRLIVRSDDYSIVAEGGN